jgi:predicted chitinase
MSVRGVMVYLASATVASTLSFIAPVTASATGGGETRAAPFVVGRSQFNAMFPHRNPFYTYQGLINALGAYPGFAGTGGETTKRREAAAFLANVSHETDGLKYIVERNTGDYGAYCDRRQSYGCPAGAGAYYGRGPLQLSWNSNYKAAGDALHINLLNDPYKVERDPAVSWKTALWFWNTERGAGTMTPHDAMAGNRGFGETIRGINGALECDGKNPGQRQDRINLYNRFTGILGTSAGANQSC